MKALSCVADRLLKLAELEPSESNSLLSRSMSLYD